MRVSGALFFVLGLLVLNVGVSQTAKAHDGTAARVEFEVNSPSTSSVVAGTMDFNFDLVDTKNNVVVTDKDLEVSMEKKLHFIVYDESLGEFQHIHPEFVNGHWDVTLKVTRNGGYWLWAQGQLAVDQVDFNASTRLTVTGGTVANPLPPKLGDVRRGVDGKSVVTLSGKVVAGQMAMLKLEFSRLDGTAPVLTPYLGSPAHIIEVSSDGDAIIHAHPMALSGQPTKLMLHTTFAEKGDYRVWVQFVDGGMLKVVPLSVSVN
jgi:hypothetical protein